MSTDFFSISGYVSVLLCLIVILLWIFYLITGPRRLICPIALILVILSLCLANYNSKNYVNLIQLDRSEEIVAKIALEEAKLKALKESRGNELSDIQFAEDSMSDSLDRAGMEQEDLKYLDSLVQKKTPDWKKNKKARTDKRIINSIDSAVGGDNAINAVDSESLNAMEEEAPIVMKEKELNLVNRLDSLNLKIIKLLLIFSLIMAIYDYLKRANMHGKESYPLPLPSAWVNAFTPLSTIVELTKPVDLAHLAKRGDCFVYCTDKKERAEALPDSYSRYPLNRKKMDVIRTDGPLGPIDDSFIFETLWFGRSSFVVDTTKRANQLLDSIMMLLEKRNETRARVSQNVHIIWDVSEPIYEIQKEKFAMLAGVTGFSLIVTAQS